MATDKYYRDCTVTSWKSFVCLFSFTIPCFCSCKPFLFADTKVIVNVGRAMDTDKGIIQKKIYIGDRTVTSYGSFVRAENLILSLLIYHFGSVINTLYLAETYSRKSKDSRTVCKYVQWPQTKELSKDFLLWKLWTCGILKLLFIN